MGHTEPWQYLRTYLVDIWDIQIDHYLASGNFLLESLHVWERGRDCLAARQHLDSGVVSYKPTNLLATRMSIGLPGIAVLTI